MFRKHKLTISLRNNLLKLLKQINKKIPQNQIVKAENKEDLSDSPTQAKQFTHADVFLSNLEQAIYQNKHPKAKVSFSKSPLTPTSSTHTYLKRVTLILISGLSIIYSSLKKSILKVKATVKNNLQKKLDASLVNTKKNLYHTSSHLTHLRKSLLGAINVLATYVERRLSLREHLGLISSILIKALVIGIVSCTLLLIFLGIALSLI